MAKIDLDTIGLYEKLDWLVEAFGETEAVEKVISQFWKPELIISKMQDDHNSEYPGDLTGVVGIYDFILCDWSAMDIIDFFNKHENVEQHINYVLVEEQMDNYESF
jgi:hypothetical protein